MTTIKHFADAVRFLDDICPDGSPEIANVSSPGLRPLNDCALDFLEDRLECALRRVRQAQAPRPRKPGFPKLTEAEKELILSGNLRAKATEIL